MPSRRSVLVGLGGLVAGGGALIGTGAFTTVEAERTVNVSTAGDASGFLGLEAADRPDNSTATPGNATSGANQNEYVQETNGTIVINLDGGSDGDNDDAGTGLNQSAITTFQELVTVTNNGTQTVDSLTLDMIVENVDTSNSNVPSGTIASDVESTFQFTASDGSNSVTVDENTDILSSSNLGASLTPGDAVDFGLKINLISDRNPGSLNDLPTADYTLSILAETANS